MRVAPLLLAAHRRNDIVGAVHVVVGRRRDVGPVRLDVGEMQAPWLVAGLADEVDAAPRHVGRLGVLLLHPRRLARVPHRPAGRELVVVALRRVGPVVPRVLARVSLFVEVAVIARRFGSICPAGPRACMPSSRSYGSKPHSATRTPMIEPDRCQAAPCLRCRRPCGSCRPARSARRAGGSNRPWSFRRPQRDAVPVRAMRLHVAAGVGAHARGAADRRLHIGAREPHAARSQPVDVRCFQRRMTGQDR